MEKADTNDDFVRRQKTAIDPDSCLCCFFFFLLAFLLLCLGRSLAPSPLGAHSICALSLRRMPDSPPSPSCDEMTIEAPSNVPTAWLLQVRGPSRPLILHAANGRWKEGAIVALQAWWASRAL
jgi:hypothetical protein